MNLKQDQQLQKQCKAWARAECGNYVSGRCVEEDRDCHLINPRYPTIQEGAIDCDWFIHAVLPTFEALQEDIDILTHMPIEEYEDGLPKRACVKCGVMFQPASNRQENCPVCQEKQNRAMARERKRKQRQKKA